jgi:hypothetical protein
MNPTLGTQQFPFESTPAIRICSRPTDVPTMADVYRACMKADKQLRGLETNATHVLPKCFHMAAVSMRLCNCALILVTHPCRLHGLSPFTQSRSLLRNGTTSLRHVVEKNCRVVCHSTTWKRNRSRYIYVVEEEDDDPPKYEAFNR